MKQSTLRKSPTVLIVAIVAVVLVVAVTLASIFTQIESVSRLFTLSNLVASADISFFGGADVSDYQTEYGIKASADPLAPNYIGKLRVSVKYKGQGVGLIRVRIAEEWSTTANSVRKVLPFKLQLPYTIDSPYITGQDSGNAKKWFDNRDNDQHFYYATPVRCTSNSVEKTIPLISGGLAGSFNTNLLPAGADIHVVVEADVVQVNRYPQYWGMNSLPWVGGVSLTQEDLSA